jgi:hypothetical protein
MPKWIFMQGAKLRLPAMRARDAPWLSGNYVGGPLETASGAFFGYLHKFHDAVFKNGQLRASAIVF